MATVAVTCIKNGRSDKFGTSLVAGAKYTIDFDLALSLWNGGFISVSDPSIFNPTKSPYWAQQGVSRSLSFDTGYSGKLLASLTAASTATRVGLVVTVSSTAHGIPSGNYLGADVFSPGAHLFRPIGITNSHTPLIIALPFLYRSELLGPTLQGSLSTAGPPIQRKQGWFQERFQPGR